MTDPPMPPMDYLDKGRRVIALEAAELTRLHDRLDGPAFGRAIELLLKCLEHRGKIVVVGVGKSGHIGQKIAATLTSTGSPAVVLDSLNALHGDLGVVADGDAVLALSASGETDELNNLLPALLRFDIGLVALTGRSDSTLARSSHVCLDVSVTQEACPLNLAPTSSTTVMLALGDALAMVLLEARGFDKEAFARFHPGGRLGRSLLLRVHQVMRPAGEIAFARPDTTIGVVLGEIARRRAGAAVIVDAEGRLAGIFTHGDFARHFQQDAAGLGERAVGEIMTRRPVAIEGDRLAVEVLQLLEHSRIDDLVVIDADGRPIGLIDTQDLTRLRLL
jgi:arabinose-5-phosphate isomerase